MGNRQSPCDNGSYLVRGPSFNGSELIISIPLLVRRPLLSKIMLDMRGTAGIIALIIEQIKKKAQSDLRWDRQSEQRTRFPHQFASIIELSTIVLSPSALASDI